MELKLPANLAALLGPLFEVLPLERAMPELVPTSLPQGRGAQQYESVAEQAYAAAAHAIAHLDDHPELQAGLWLYVDDLERSHQVSQSIAGPVGAYWHGVMHRREGDFSNAKYWFRQAVGVRLSVDGVDLVDKVSGANGQSPPDLLELQRREWAELMERSS